jgi:signal transduction histidine kinase
VPHKERANLNVIIEEVVDVIRKNYSSLDLTVTVALQEDAPRISADPIQLQQLVFNILRNGVEAMLSNREEPMILSIRSWAKGDTVTVKVTDNGIGLADPHQVFDPFFTTKSDGMGIGLSVCRTIVDAHRGRLWAEAHPSRGASFTFELPVHDAVMVQDRDVGDPPQSFGGSS